ncbi:MAG TPA: methionine synthase, partial [Spirochaetota bacterium]|nr:methionine synthase [Spirochaetota bacterium]
MTNINKLNTILKKRILILDGAMGTAIQQQKPAEKDFRGELFKNHAVSLEGCNDILCLTQPQRIKKIHLAYLEAGSDLITTNTFNATPVSLSDYKLESYTYQLNKKAARLAAEACSIYNKKDPSRPRFVVGTMGPTGKAASISPDINRPAYRNISFDILKHSYKQQAQGLLEGGVDIIMLETVFDALNCKAGLAACREIFAEKNKTVPLMISVTISDASGRTLAGQTLAAFYNSVYDKNIWSVGLNCSLGAKELKPYLARLTALNHSFTSIHPNAGLPDQLGNYTQSAAAMSSYARSFAKAKMINIIGGCCGTTPDYITAIAAAVKDQQPRPLPRYKSALRLSGLQPLNVKPESRFIKISERINVAGSAAFKKIILKQDYRQAAQMVTDQIEAGADIININLDDSMIDAAQTLPYLLNLLASEPAAARVPFMIDSSQWKVLEAGLKCIQGKAVVNSISLKQGESELLNRACEIKKYNAAAVVSAFDEKGQAVDTAAKVAVCKRAYSLLTEKADFNPEDIIFDPNVLTVGTGIREHNNYAVNFIEAVRILRRDLPSCHITGGISNVSYAFRGNKNIRDKMHSIFLHHCRRAGLSMGIVNPAAMLPYQNIPPEQRSLLEDLLLNRSPDAAEKIVAAASRFSKEKGKSASVTAKKEKKKWRFYELEERINHAIRYGITSFIEQDIKEALVKYKNPVKIIEKPLMNGMQQVGNLFSKGKMFLPEIIKSARVMKTAVALIEPEIKKKQLPGQKQAVIILATVKGDVHDIGKNIVGVVLSCNNYRIIDMGVKVSPRDILEKAVRENAAVIGLSGLITPSLQEMIHIAAAMEKKKMRIPLVIGGATTSTVHTALKIDPLYSGPVIRIPDASQSVTVVNSLLDNRRKQQTAAFYKNKYAALRARNSTAGPDLISLKQARQKSYQLKNPAPAPLHKGIKSCSHLPLGKLKKVFNWEEFFHLWGIKGKYPRLLNQSVKTKQARQLYNDTCNLLQELESRESITVKTVYAVYPANKSGDDIIVYDPKQNRSEKARLYFLRQQHVRAPGTPSLCLADFLKPAAAGEDHIGFFAVNAGCGMDKLLQDYNRANDT